MAKSVYVIESWKEIVSDLLHKESGNAQVERGEKQENGSGEGEEVANGDWQGIESWAKQIENGEEEVGRYVVALYENEPFPGIIRKVAQNECYIECLQKQNYGDRTVFSWPKKKDRCWYPNENIKAFIPQPEQIAKSVYVIKSWEEIVSDIM
ncbi:hypothetical protein KP79_PYT23030 [Mizuhopecten yessoensis]|uniref:Uncharacterized protein n=1 Tax=Mizuhopecten yessoensis TaxID=6573 RepID=A0A210QTQ6_MIZYE|nr:hypothetical protein KP79_PYT23030 [Mizuhopecten yessoensis]